VVAAFVSVIYRRQSDVDQARARDLKLVYDLQLDREISARREYELTVESQLRRELATELRAQSADEVSELRAELAALRTNLEILFDAELSDRPALESDRKRGRGYSDWERDNESARERINRVASVRAEEPVRRSDDTIIDVHEEPLVPPPPPTPPPQQPRQPAAETYHQAYAPEAYPPSRQNRNPEPPEPERGSHRRTGEAEVPRNEPALTGGWTPPGSPVERPRENQSWPQPQGQPSGWAPPNPAPTTGPQRSEPPPPRRSHRRPETPEPQFAPPAPPPPPEPVQPSPPQPERQFAPIPPQPEAPQQPRIPWPPPAAGKPRQQPEQPPASWQPVSPDGQWLPAGSPGSNWNPGSPEGLAAPSSWAYDNGPSRDMPSHRAPSTDGPAEPSLERRGRHSSAPADPSPPQTDEPAAEWGEPGRRSRSRHASDHPEAAAPPAPAMSPPPPPPPPPPTPAPDRGPVMSPPPPASARHRSADEPEEPEEPQSGGQSVADLLARLQTSPSEGGGRRRRRED
jgi:hypothetical protein